MYYFEDDVAQATADAGLRAVAVRGTSAGMFGTQIPRLSPGRMPLSDSASAIRLGWSRADCAVARSWSWRWELVISFM